jgi:mono/diheme cytochrome c family protein
MKPYEAVIVCIVLGAGGCRRSWHPEPFDPDAVRPSLAAADETRPAARSREPAAEPSLERKRRMAQMQRHFEVVATLEAAVVEGDLHGLHDLAQGFATAQRNAEHPSQWSPHVDRLVQAAERAGQAPTIDAAADAVAALAGTCGDCHRALEVVPPAPDVPPFDEGDTAAAAMRRHAWSVDRMWAGIVLPSEVHWIRGTAMFTFPPGCDRGPNDAEPTRDEALCRRVSGLGQQAHVAPDWPSRTELYGRLLATCAQCHASARPR